MGGSGVIKEEGVVGLKGKKWCHKRGREWCDCRGGIGVGEEERVV
jgi:hypothetical protein